ncbi:NADH-quinone oxidoreductase subunit G [Gordonia alkaliphila]|uniref:NADH-quinone oxidoreductase subunit G n=1 Tax=Gordonia alkaliphila TaxID=1053547 RepID=UPI001FF1D19F|nr:NADH-quinone oxidoreductase subunit G [Gordonia alkaliphila]MCK0440222.1 NADH-quinone oxidoreductase subunit G [Gordonia alkaliphila]
MTGPDLVTLTIDDVEVTVPAGTLVIRAAELAGIEIPRFCDHPLMAPVGACRQCLVEISGQRKPMASCTIPVAQDMVVRTQHTSAEAERAQSGVMELLLINHPLDCPTCDKGGECPLQNQAVSAGRPQSRFTGTKRIYTKPVPLSSAILLDRERCVLCARCTRFADEIAGDPLIELADRSALEQVSAYADEPFDSYFSGNTVQICPVGALTGTAYRFRARPFDLVSTPSVCEHCAAGCAQRTDHRRGTVLRRQAGDDPEVNEEWNCDKGRWAFTYTDAPDRLRVPLVRGEDGALAPASWSHALATAARGLTGGGARAAALVGGRATVEDAYAYGKFARTVLHTNDVDVRIRSHSAEETDFLAAHVAGTGIGVTYAQLQAAPVVVLAGLEPEEECPILYLRLRKSVRRNGMAVIALAPWRTPGADKTAATVLPCLPGEETALLASEHVRAQLAVPGAVLLVGERLADAPGALTAAIDAAAATGAGFAWVPRRAGERGALDVGVAPNLLPAGRPVVSERARRDLAAVWGVVPPAEPGRDTAQILDALAVGELTAVVTGAVDLDDLPDPKAGRRALRDAFVVSLEQRPSSVTEFADVVFPVAVVAEKAGTFVDWEGRPRGFEAALSAAADGRATLSDHRVLHALAAAVDVDLHCDSAADIHREFAAIGPWEGERVVPAPVAAAESSDTAPRRTGTFVLATWRMLLGAGRLQENEPHLAGTARRPVVRLSPAAAAALELRDGDAVTCSTDRGEVTLPLAITDMPDRAVWLPMNAPGATVPTRLGGRAGIDVQVRAAR